MSLAAAVFVLPPEPYYPTIYRLTVVPNAAKKAHACLRYYLHRWNVKDGRIVGLKNGEGAEWCTEQFGDDELGKGGDSHRSYGSTRRRCFQKGLEILEKMGIIRREYHRGVRTIVILTKLPEPKAPAKRRIARPKPAAADKATELPPDEPADPAEVARFARDLAAKSRADAAATAAPRRGPSLASAAKPPPEVARERVAAALARIEAIPASQRTPDDEARRVRFAAELAAHRRE